MSENWTILSVLEWTTSRFQRSGIDCARLEAQILLSHTLGCDRIGLYTQFDKPLGPAELAAYRSLIKRRLSGAPVAYLVGEQEFWSLRFRVDESVLIPRRDTETVIEVILDSVDMRESALAIADIATGSGAIGITLARELPRARVMATDVSERALLVCAGNVAHHGVEDRVDVRAGDLFATVAEDERFDIVVSNPPYVRSADLGALSPEVNSEPRLALDGGPDGLGVIARLVREAPGYLQPDGLLVLEHGWDQAEDVARLIAGTGRFSPAQTRRDMGGNPRVTWARASRDHRDPVVTR